MCGRQRRLSDPSANLSHFVRGAGAWRSKAGAPGTTTGTRSEDEGLDSLSAALAEVEAGDLRDGQSIT